MTEQQPIEKTVFDRAMLQTVLTNHVREVWEMCEGMMSRKMTQEQCESMEAGFRDRLAVTLMGVNPLLVTQLPLTGEALIRAIEKDAPEVCAPMGELDPDPYPETNAESAQMLYIVDRFIVEVHLCVTRVITVMERPEIGAEIARAMIETFVDRWVAILAGKPTLN